jgi:hypothetical protein
MSDDRIDALFAQYITNTKYLSGNFRSAEEFEPLAAEGRDILPYLFKWLMRTQCVWALGALLHEVVGDEFPTVPEEHRGKLMWVLHSMWSFGARHGYLPMAEAPQIG